ncbi:MAG: peptide deformylase [Planctomycetes bacterium]|nr:peptide deformylase [Planctomycetota bacterium]
MILEVAQLGQPVLRMVAAEVRPERIAWQPMQDLLSDMQETLAAQKGVGLAAPQVFASVRVFLAAILPRPSEGALPGVEVFINPKLAPLTDEMIYAWEGCLSFAELSVRVPRFRAVRVAYLNAMGQLRALDLEGFPARVVQHEFDHLNGVLTLDRADSTHDIIKASEIDDVLDESDDAED